jgi:hypothetical protein
MDGAPQVVVRIDVGELRRVDQAVQKGRDLGSALGARAVMIFTGENHTANDAFGGVVVWVERWIVEEAQQRLLSQLDVAECVAQTARRRNRERVNPAASRSGRVLR